MEKAGTGGGTKIATTHWNLSDQEGFGELQINICVNVGKFGYFLDICICVSRHFLDICIDICVLISMWSPFPCS